MVVVTMLFPRLYPAAPRTTHPTAASLAGITLSAFVIRMSAAIPSPLGLLPNSLPHILTPASTTHSTLQISKRNYTLCIDTRDIVLLMKGPNKHFDIDHLLNLTWQDDRPHSHDADGVGFFSAKG